MAAFTTIAAGVSLAATATTTGMSFAQAGAERRKMEAAQKKAAEAMIEAREKLEVNVYDELDINKEAYELEREALLTQGATALQAATEGSARGAAAAAGRVQMAQQAGQAKIRTAMDQEVKALEKLSAQEDSRLRDIGVQLDLGEVEGAQLAARDAEARRNAAMQQGMQGIVSAVGQAASFVPLYQQSQGAKALDKAMANNPNLQADLAKQGTIGGVDTSGVGSMTDLQFKDFMTQNFDAKGLKAIPDRMNMPVSTLQSKPIQPFPIQDPFDMSALLFNPQTFGQ